MHYDDEYFPPNETTYSSYETNDDKHRFQQNYYSEKTTNQRYDNYRATNPESNFTNEVKKKKNSLGKFWSIVHYCM